jgi:hypothetical protein
MLLRWGSEQLGSMITQRDAARHALRTSLIAIVVGSSLFAHITFLEVICDDRALADMAPLGIWCWGVLTMCLFLFAAPVVAWNASLYIKTSEQAYMHSVIISATQQELRGALTLAEHDDWRPLQRPLDELGPPERGGFVGGPRLLAPRNALLMFARMIALRVALAWQRVWPRRAVSTAGQGAASGAPSRAVAARRVVPEPESFADAWSYWFAWTCFVNGSALIVAMFLLAALHKVGLISVEFFGASLLTGLVCVVVFALWLAAEIVEVMCGVWGDYYRDVMKMERLYTLSEVNT